MKCLDTVWNHSSCVLWILSWFFFFVYYFFFFVTMLISVYLVKYVLFVSCAHLNVLSNPYAGMTPAQLKSRRYLQSELTVFDSSFVRTGVNHGLCATDGPRLLHWASKIFLHWHISACARYNLYDTVTKIWFSLRNSFDAVNRIIYTVSESFLFKSHFTKY